MNKKVKLFIEFDFEKQKKIILDFLEKLSENGEKSKRLLKIIPDYKETKINRDYLISVYESIINSIERLKKDKIDKKINNFNENKNKLSLILEEEKIEKDLDLEFLLKDLI